MSTYTVYNAKTHLSSLIEQACAGEEVIIAKGRTPLVKLVPLAGVAAPPVRRDARESAGGRRPLSCGAIRDKAAIAPYAG